MRYICFDVETTGLDTASGHRVFEIGCVEIVDRVKTGRTFHSYCNPERLLSKESKEICKMEDAFLVDKPKFANIADGFVDFITNNGNGEIEKAILLAHNAKFDTNFINNEFKLSGLVEILNEFTIIDTIKIAKKKFPGQPASLDAISSRLGLSLLNREEKGHGALLDSDLLADVFIKLSEDDSDNDITNMDASEVIFFGFAKQKKQIEPRNIGHANEIELASHLSMLKCIRSDI